MINLSTIEVNSVGTVLSVSTPTPSLLHGLFPSINGNITTHYDEPTNLLIKERLNLIFNSTVSIEFPLIINNFPLQCTAHHYTRNKAFIYFKHIESSVAEDLQYVILHKNEAARLKLAEFSFQNVYSPIAFIREDGTFFYFNHATATFFGYSMEEFSHLTVFDINGTYSPSQWQDQWNEIRQNEKLTLFSKLQTKDGKWMDAEVRTNMLSFGDLELNCTFYTNITEKKKIEEQLKLVEYTYMNATTAIQLIKADNTIYDFNEAMPFMLGYTPEEYKHITLLDLDPYKNQEGWTTLWANMKKLKVLEVQRKLKRKNGSLIDVNLINYGDKELNCVFITDITEKKKILEKLKLVDFAFNNASTPILLVKSDGTFYDFNLATLSLFGYSKEEMMALKVLDIDPDANSDVRKTIWDTIRASDTLLHYRRMKRKNGSWMDLEVKANLIKKGDLELNCAFITDITEKKKEELRLKLLESVILQTDEAIVVTEAEPITLPGPRILFVNDAYTRMTGYKSEEVIGQTPRITQNKNTQRDELDKVAVAFKNWQPFDITVINETKTGEEFWVNVRATPIADEKGWFTHWVAIQRNVTKEIEAAKEKQTLVDELIENNKELVQFSYITTHNLRAPLTNLIAICKRIDTKFIEDEQTLKLIEGFKQSTSLLNDTLNDLIKILIIKENRHIVIAECNFVDTLEKVKKSISTILLKNVVKIETDFSDATTVSFVCIYLESIFLNLLTNSIKYAHPTRYPVIKIKTFLDADGHTKLTFSDNGRGMNMERVKNKIFGLYQRFHSNADGKGIGLYLIHSQVTALGGKVDVESEEGIGTTFTITFK